MAHAWLDACLDFIQSLYQTVQLTKLAFHVQLTVVIVIIKPSVLILVAARYNSTMEKCVRDVHKIAVAAMIPPHALHVCHSIYWLMVFVKNIRQLAHRICCIMMRGWGIVLHALMVVRVALGHCAILALMGIILIMGSVFLKGVQQKNTIWIIMHCLIMYVSGTTHYAKSNQVIKLEDVKFVGRWIISLH
jgi:hypothetical protein